jgi:3-oxoacyl-[acyl-carrier protein] reductase
MVISNFSCDSGASAQHNCFWREENEGLNRYWSISWNRTRRCKTPGERRFAVVVNFAGNAAKADEVVAAIKTAGGQAIAIQADVAKPADVEHLFKTTLEALGSMDVVVNNAGIMPLSPIAKGDVDVFDKVIATNLRGTFLVLSQAAQYVSPGGRIIAFSSSVLAKSFPTYGPYIAAKAGVEGLVRVLANELRGKQITVNAIAPGPLPPSFF